MTENKVKLGEKFFQDLRLLSFGERFNIMQLRAKLREKEKLKELKARVRRNQ